MPSVKVSRYARSSRSGKRNRLPVLAENDEGDGKIPVFCFGHDIVLSEASTIEYTFRMHVDRVPNLFYLLPHLSLVIVHCTNDLSTATPVSNFS